MKMLLICAATFAFASTASAGETKLTKDDLLAAHKILMDAYGKDKYDAVLKRVIGRLGPVQKSGDNMSSWFGKDGTTCFQFWVTQADKNTAAGGLASSTDDAQTGCK